MPRILALLVGLAVSGRTTPPSWHDLRRLTVALLTAIILAAAAALAAAA